MTHKDLYDLSYSSEYEYIDVLLQASTIIDQNDSYIGVSSLTPSQKKVLKKGLKHLDTDGNNVINYEEGLNAYQNICRKTTSIPEHQATK